MNCLRGIAETWQELEGFCFRARARKGSHGGMRTTDILGREEDEETHLATSIRDMPSNNKPSGHYRRLQRTMLEELDFNERVKASLETIRQRAEFCETERV